MNKQEKLNLYNEAKEAYLDTYKLKLAKYKEAKEAYYNGQEIMTDYEFDQLEKELGLENKSEVGSKHNPSYTVKHPYIMGSLSKVQIHEVNGKIDWNKHYKEMRKFAFKDCNYIITPKYDGCSFEIYVKNGNVTISSRGDGNWGKDLKKHLMRFFPNKLFNLSNEFTLRGEVLVKKSIFEKKYSEQFTNPRSFVSGVLNNDYSDDKDFQEKLNDLSVMIYDYRICNDGKWEDYDWTEILHRITSDSSFFNEDIDIIENMLPNYVKVYPIYKDEDHLKYVYEEFEDYRKECEFALDGFVIKPEQNHRENNTEERRPKDCVAIKFIPMLQETEVVNITWNLGKTHEFIPIIWTKPVEMDGKMVQKCSGHNLGYLRQKGITIGAKIIMSLAGDIIPFMYKVTQTNPNGEIPMPTTYGYYEDDIHLMALMEMKDRTRMQFISSVDSLNIPTIGDQTAKDIWDYLDNSDEMTMEFFDEDKKDMPFNILLVSPDEVYFGVGAGKFGQNAKKSFEEIIRNISLVDIIKSCNFPFCGDKVAEQIVNYFLDSNPDFSHLASEGYLWVSNTNSWQYKQLITILNHLGKTFEDFKVTHEEAKKIATNQIPIIMTGEPNNYSTKSEFLKCHPEYRNTGSWKEVQIVFTNSMDSNTGKMKKAMEKGIRIELY